ncbi:MAG: hypothetical protein ACR2KT_03265 [Methylocella sp.]|nr:MAG: hypothetical protein DLM68_07635 [Hyphomicrobiales bacterium]
MSGPLIPDFRALVHSVTVHPKAKGEDLQVAEKGKLAALIGGKRSPGNNVGVCVVAEVRYIANPTIEHALFCYWRQAA